jgi:hypothetical protein
VAELDQRIETILIQRLTQVIEAWCAEFDRTEDGDVRRDQPLAKDKRRVDKRAKDDKVSKSVFAVSCSHLRHEFSP